MFIVVSQEARLTIAFFIPLMSALAINFYFVRRCMSNIIAIIFSARQEKDPQADVLPKIKEIFGFAEFRKVLNDVNGVFDEDTQRGTDLIVR